MSELTVDDIRELFLYGVKKAGNAGYPLEMVRRGTPIMTAGREMFDHWLAEHDRQVAATAWDEGYRDGVHDEAHADGSDQKEPPTPNPYREVTA